MFGEFLSSREVVLMSFSPRNLFGYKLPRDTLLENYFAKDNLENKDIDWLVK